MPKNIKHLVVDTTAFIKAANLQDIAENIYTVQEVVDEITNDRQRRKLVVLPYDLKVKNVFAENVKFITEFSKKTGDYTSLSATDIKVMALTYQLEKETVGINHLKNEPTMQKTLKVTGLAGFNPHPETNNSNANSTTEIQANSIKTEDQESKHELCTTDKDVTQAKGTVEVEKEQNSDKINVELRSELQSTEKSKDKTVQVEDTNEDDETSPENIAEQMKNIDINVDDVMVKVADDEEEDEESEEDDDESDGDDEWITPGNLAQKKKEMEMGEFEEKSVEVACITSDFAMQNVMKQIGLNVTAIDGRIIRQLRTFIFRCTTCFKTTSVMSKLFCPKCGHATLKKVAVSIDEDGNQHIHINGRKPLTARGKRFSLPTPKGGQHFQYPILTEDQHIHKRFATKMARGKTNALDPDYIAGFSPFAMKDVNSKSAVLGVRANKQDVKYWMKNYSKGKK